MTHWSKLEDNVQEKLVHGNLPPTLSFDGSYEALKAARTGNLSCWRSIMLLITNNSTPPPHINLMASTTAPSLFSHLPIFQAISVNHTTSFHLHQPVPQPPPATTTTPTTTTLPNPFRQLDRSSSFANS
jgi:hypothetical protein